MTPMAVAAALAYLRTRVTMTAPTPQPARPADGPVLLPNSARLAALKAADVCRRILTDHGVILIRPGDWDMPDTPSDRLARFTDGPSTVPDPAPLPPAIEEIPTHWTVRIEGR